MDTYAHKTMASIVSLEKIEIIRSEAKILRKKNFKGLKLPFWGLNFVEFWCWGLIFGGQGGLGPWAPPGSAPAVNVERTGLSALAVQGCM